MKNEFITTANISRFDHICKELEDPASLIGPSLAMVTGAAGRGKSEAAKHYAVNSSAIFIPPIEPPTRAVMFRQIAFELASVRPTRSDQSLNIIGDAMAKNRRLVIVDEADLLPKHVLEALRHLNENYAFPILLIGEDELKRKLGSETRLRDRVRRRMEFDPVNQVDVAFFFKKSIGVQLSKDVSAVIQRYSEGTWRKVLKFAVAAEGVMAASGLTDIAEDMAKDIIKELVKDETGKRKDRA